MSEHLIVMIGKERFNNPEVVPKHWSTDSYPQSGDRPQELLNKAGNNCFGQKGQRKSQH